MSAPPPGVQPKGIRIERGRAVTLHPMGVGETLDAAFKLYRSAWKIFVGAAAIILVPLNFIQAFLTRSNLGAVFNVNEPRATPSDSVLGATAIFFIVTLLLVNPFLTALYARATSELYLGTKPELNDALRFARSKIGSILLISILTGLAVFGGFILLVIPGIIFFVRFAFANAAMVVEDERGREAMGRSWRLAKGHFWRLFGTLFLITIITTFVTGAIGLPLSLAANAIGPSGWPLAAIGSSVASVIARPLVVIVVVVLYFDLRIRKEGFDITLMIDDLSRGPGA